MTRPLEKRAVVGTAVKQYRRALQDILERKPAHNTWGSKLTSILQDGELRPGTRNRNGTGVYFHTNSPFSEREFGDFSLSAPDVTGLKSVGNPENGYLLSTASVPLHAARSVASLDPNGATRAKPVLQQAQQQGLRVVGGVPSVAAHLAASGAGVPDTRELVSMSRSADAGARVNPRELFSKTAESGMYNRLEQLQELELLAKEAVSKEWVVAKVRNAIGNVPSSRLEDAADRLSDLSERAYRASNGLSTKKLPNRQVVEGGPLLTDSPALRAIRAARAEAAGAGVDELDAHALGVPPMAVVGGAPMQHSLPAPARSSFDSPPSSPLDYAPSAYAAPAAPPPLSAAPAAEEAAATASGGLLRKHWPLLAVPAVAAGAGLTYAAARQPPSEKAASARFELMAAELRKQAVAVVPPVSGGIGKIQGLIGQALNPGKAQALQARVAAGRQALEAIPKPATHLLQDVAHAAKPPPLPVRNVVPSSTPALVSHNPLGATMPPPPSMQGVAPGARPPPLPANRPAPVAAPVVPGDSGRGFRAPPKPEVDLTNEATYLKPVARPPQKHVVPEHLQLTPERRANVPQELTPFHGREDLIAPLRSHPHFQKLVNAGFDEPVAAQYMNMYGNELFKSASALENFGHFMQYMEQSKVASVPLNQRLDAGKAKNVLGRAWQLVSGARLNGLEKLVDKHVNVADAAQTVLDAAKKQHYRGPLINAAKLVDYAEDASKAFMSAGRELKAANKLVAIAAKEEADVVRARKMVGLELVQKGVGLLGNLVKKGSASPAPFSTDGFKYVKAGLFTKEASLQKRAISEDALNNVGAIAQKRTLVTDHPLAESTGVGMIPVRRMPSDVQSVAQSYKGRLENQRSVLEQVKKLTTDKDVLQQVDSHLQSVTPEGIDSIVEGMHPQFAAGVEQVQSLKAQLQGKTQHPYPIIRHPDFHMGELAQDTTGVQLDPRNMKAVENLALMHEMHEGRSARELPRKARVEPTYFSHLDPKVILREHNALATLPVELHPARDAMSGLRAAVEAPSLSPYKVDFGKSQRLSRHAVKHISKMVTEDAIPNAARHTLAQLADAAAYMRNLA